MSRDVVIINLFTDYIRNNSEDISSGPRRVKAIMFVANEFLFVEVFNKFLVDNIFKKV